VVTHRFPGFLFMLLFVALTPLRMMGAVISGDLGSTNAPVPEPKKESLVSCIDQMDRIRQLAGIEKLPLPAELEFQGQFLMKAGQPCTNPIDGAAGPANAANTVTMMATCQICTVQGNSFAAEELRFSGKRTVTGMSTEYAGRGTIIAFETNHGKMKLVCNPPAYRGVALSLSEVCVGLSNLAGGNGKGIVLRSKEIIQNEASLQPAKPASNPVSAKKIE
jgi:hypothetical protein